MKKIGLVLVLLAACDIEGTHNTFDTIDASVDPVCISAAEFEALKKEHTDLEAQLSECEANLDGCENTPAPVYECTKAGKSGKCAKSCTK